MHNIGLLSNRFKIYIEDGHISNVDFPHYIKSNLNSNLKLREYQVEALNSLIYYIEKFRQKTKPIHLLFNMATGSGKTLVMASNILYLFNKGYRNFIFFVDSTNIIEKTKQNFLNKLSSKYLFSDYLEINNKKIEVRQVSNFDESDNEAINIVFTTIQGLHMRMNTPAENSLTYEDFTDKKIVLLSDEAHHINTLTKTRLNKTEEEMKSSWENTVTTILNSNIENILLEYTATIGLDNEQIYDKYKDKIIYKYDLRDYREDKYSKEITVLRSNQSIKDRVLQSVILSEYRRKLAEKNGLIIKPVILIKSNTIAESNEVFNDFQVWIESLDVLDLTNIKDVNKDNIVSRAFDFFEKEDITNENLAIEIKNNFSYERCIEVNSKNESEEKQLIVNSLEEKTNPYRIIFAVDMLNEGWDVLNLFDIVRVNEKRGSRNTTIKEAQLIGRGARYYPFKLNVGDDKYKRKFDDDIESETRILENLFYHSINEPKYISDLKIELEKIGIVARDDEKIEIKLRIKDEFKNSKLYKKGYILTNKQERNDNVTVESLADIKIKSSYDYNINTGRLYETIILDEQIEQEAENLNRTTFEISKYPKNVLRKGVSVNNFFRFSNLNSYFPHLNSIEEFLDNNNYLGGLDITLIGDYENKSDLDNETLLQSFLYLLKEVEKQIVNNYIPYKGTKEFFFKSIRDLKLEKTSYISVGGQDKESGKSMSINDGSELRLNLANEKWYVYEDNFGTTEEKNLILLMKELHEQMLNKGYDEIYLLRNEKVLRLYNFDDERVMEPDFILFAKKSQEDENIIFQVFIESKGEHLLLVDQWKEELLLNIEEQHKILYNTKDYQSFDMDALITGHSDIFIENEEYRLIGLSFYYKNNEKSFKKEFEEKLAI